MFHSIQCYAANAGYGVTKEKKEKKKNEDLTEWQRVKVFIHITLKAIEIIFKIDCR